MARQHSAVILMKKKATWKGGGSSDVEMTMGNSKSKSVAAVALVVDAHDVSYSLGVVFFSLSSVYFVMLGVVTMVTYAPVIYHRN